VKDILITDMIGGALNKYCNISVFDPNSSKKRENFGVM